VIVDTSALRTAYAEFLEVAETGKFGPPPAGEWDAEHLLAHVYTAHSQIASTALAVLAGSRPSYDNRMSLDDMNLRRVIDQAGGLAGLVDLVGRGGELYCAVADQVSERDALVPVSVLIVSGHKLVVDEPRPLGQLLTGVGSVHLPGHAEQLRSLLAMHA